MSVSDTKSERVRMVFIIIRKTLDDITNPCGSPATVSAVVCSGAEAICINAEPKSMTSMPNNVSKVQSMIQVFL
jgi:hypothetical protein